MERHNLPTLNRFLKSVAIYGTLLLVCAFALFPLVWAVTTSIKTQDSIVSYPPRWIPNPVTMDQYRLVIFGSNAPKYFYNSCIVTICTVVVTLLVGSLGGYSAARYEFPLKNALLFLILTTVMVPGIVVLVPLYVIVTKIGLYDTYASLILIYTAWQIPSVLWLMRGFFESIPRELEEAALIDGCTPFQALYRVIIPLAQPGLAAAAVIVFVYSWNEFLIALTMTNSEDKRLITTGLYYYVGAFGVEWGKLMAATVAALAPAAIFFVILQRRFIEGLTSGATKG